MAIEAVTFVLVMLMLLVATTMAIVGLLGIGGAAGLVRCPACSHLVISGRSKPSCPYCDHVRLRHALAHVRHPIHHGSP
jgi:hypothetical protein